MSVDEGHGLGPTRARVLSLLQSSPDALTSAQVATRLELHDNTIRFHLDALVQAGYAEQFTRPSGGQGRPSNLYRATSSAPTVSDRHLIELTSLLVSNFLSPLPDATEQAEAAGQRWGATLGESLDADTDDQRVDRLMFQLAERGFGVSRSGDCLTFERCPFRTAVDGQTLPAICSIHQGVIQGFLKDSGASLIAGPIEVGPITCEVRLQPGEDQETQDL